MKYPLIHKPNHFRPSLNLKGYTFKGSNSIILMFASLFNWDQLLNKTFDHLGIDPILKGLRNLGKVIEK